MVLFVSVAAAIAIGLRLSGKNDSVEAFLVGNRDLPWWAILGSIVATETSTATVLSVPGAGYGPVGMRFLQITFGFLIGRTIVVQLLLPLFFQGKLMSAYEVLNKRFGGAVEKFASLLFLVTRNLGDGLRLFLAAVVLHKLAGWDLATSAIAIGAITIFYTYFGGMKSVIWNDCIQFVVYMLGAVATVFVISNQISGGWPTFWEFATTHDKLTVFQLTPPAGFSSSTWLWVLSEPFNFYAAVIGGAVLSLGTHGTDQMMVQRYLSARSERDAARAILLSAVVVSIQFALFLFIGVLLACYYAQNPGTQFTTSDEVYADFIVNHFPRNTGLVGLMLAAILAAAMSTLSSSLNASASAVLNDFYLPLTSTVPSPGRLLSITRRLAIAFGAIQVMIGIWAISLDASVVSNSLTIAGYSAGLLLGLFLLGVLTTGVRTADALIGALCGLAVLLCVQFLLPSLTRSADLESGIRVAWPWFALIGSSVTFFVGVGLARLRSHTGDERGGDV
ncbi:Sodium/glucose cotransporter [Allorhodopirellula solitaria]|uniref:Sodium/glucose cotransporter n=2 Tax=Allorhodopirellula solitaria TaxID=2527987 RepID=A0A5C5YJB4_9BACT|nr:Sodium/glucose cotransporter [Allorhodopirellula solitaria]